MTPARSLPFMMLMAVAVGVVAGFGAWGFRELIGLIHNVLFVGQFTFDYDANVHTALGPWGIGVVLVPVVGALLVAWLVGNFAPEAKGHGVPEVMDAIYYDKGRIRPRVAIIKSLASAVSIGSGASVGREGPIVQIGSAFGSTLGSLIAMRTSDRVTLIAAGAGAGIAATFNAPLGGIVFAIELLLVSINARTLLVTVTATVIAAHISRLLLGTEPSFFVPLLETPFFQINQPIGLAAFFVLGGVIGLLSVAFIRGLYATEDLFDAIPGNYYTRHALGMFCVGVMMVLLASRTGHYYVEGVGYATIMEILRGALTDPWFLLMLAGLKLLATCLSLGSGASGGVFSPALFMGAAIGAAFGQFCQTFFPGLDVTIPTFAIAGMAAAIGGSTGAVLTGIVMLTEMTKDHSIMLPLVITSAVAHAVRRAIMDESIYTMKLRARRHAVPQGLHASMLTSERIEDLMTTDFTVVREGTEVPAAAKFAVRSDDRAISGVTRYDGGSGAADAPRSLRYVVMSRQATPLMAMDALLRAEAQIVIVSRDPDARWASDVVGLVTVAALAQLLATDAELS
jgi:chloride channel protein, CIC family